MKVLGMCWCGAYQAGYTPPLCVLLCCSVFFTDINQAVPTDPGSEICACSSTVQLYPLQPSGDVPKVCAAQQELSGCFLWPCGFLSRDAIQHYCTCRPYVPAKRRCNSRDKNIICLSRSCTDEIWSLISCTACNNP